MKQTEPKSASEEAGAPELPVPDAAVDRIETLAVLLGPYRNLTTLTASICALHPQVQVMNHGSERLWAQPEIDFIATPKPEVLRQFVATSLRSSTGGRRGDYGGSILFSHAFDSEPLRELYRARYGETMLKPEARCLVWKESMRVQRRLMDGPGFAEAIVERLPQVRFLLPIRHPVHCALSNMQTGHVRFLTGRHETDPAVVVDAVLDALAWGLRLRDQWPDRVFAFHQKEAGKEMIERLRVFLGLDLDSRWLADAVAAFQVRHTHEHSRDLMAHFRRSAANKLSAWPALLEAYGV